MAVGDLVTADYMLEYNGVAFGGNTGIEVVSFAPFDNPDIRSSDINRPLDHGMFASQDYYGARSVMLELEVWGGWTAVRTVLASFQTLNTEAPLVFQLPTIGKLRVNARVRRRSSLPIDVTYSVGTMTSVTIELTCTDPRVYSDTLQSSVATLGAASSGLTFNVTPNLVFGAGTSPTTTITNGGTFETRPSIAIIGDITNFYIANDTTGLTLQFSGSSSIPLGSTLVLDFLNRTVVLNGTVSRYTWVTNSASWWTLIPGANSIRLGGTPGASTPTATVSWRDAYI